MFALMFGLIGMHSLVIVCGTHSGGAHLRAVSPAVMTHSMPEVDPRCCGRHAPPPTLASTGCPGCGHDMRHLCLAVLLVIAALVIARMLRRLEADFERVGGPSTWNAGRSPPPTGNPTELLSRLCVLRL